MITASNKYEYFSQIKTILENQLMMISESAEINYGLQFQVRFENKQGLIRVYESKKGVRHDLSQVKDEELLGLIERALSNGKQSFEIKPNKVSEKNNMELSKIDSLEEIIGADESGKGDYFGPLVVAAVFVNSDTYSTLKDMGVMDSKKLGDDQIKVLAGKIKKICPSSLVVIGNAKYNDLYEKIKNLNKLLAWGHARAIENILSTVNCRFALSDQFGDESLINKALLDKGKEITLFQRTKAESNIAVAAASILARDEFVNRLHKLSIKYNVTFTKGASTKTVANAKKFVSMHGSKELNNVAKLHFKTTDQII
ncbi:ribonuclease HIII [Cytobacillus sp. FSL R7-0680]|uniref:ribonuclease HIII n=1 Tax=Cytobacillus sp. FSL R7-0680 TaxID=2921689 RepID=UPI0030FCE903